MRSSFLIKPTQFQALRFQHNRKRGAALRALRAGITSISHLLYQVKPVETQDPFTPGSMHAIAVYNCSFMRQTQAVCVWGVKSVMRYLASSSRQRQMTTAYFDLTASRHRQTYLLIRSKQMDEAAQARYLPVVWHLVFYWLKDNELRSVIALLA